MKIEGVSWKTVDWGGLPPAEDAGHSGSARSRTAEAGNVRARIVEYSPGFRSDHWCPRGHVLLVLEGALAVDLRDGRHIQLAAGQGFLAGDDATNPHRASSEAGARVFIVD